MLALTLTAQELESLRRRGLVGQVPAPQPRDTGETLRQCIERVARRGKIFDAKDVRLAWDGFCTRSAINSALTQAVWRGTIVRVPSEGKGNRHILHQYQAQ